MKSNADIPLTALAIILLVAATIVGAAAVQPKCKPTALPCEPDCTCPAPSREIGPHPMYGDWPLPCPVGTYLIQGPSADRPWLCVAPL